jgi:hypothetical protein
MSCSSTGRPFGANATWSTSSMVWVDFLVAVFLGLGRGLAAVSEALIVFLGAVLVAFVESLGTLGTLGALGALGTVSVVLGEESVAVSVELGRQLAAVSVGWDKFLAFLSCETAAANSPLLTFVAAFSAFLAALASLDAILAADVSGGGMMLVASKSGRRRA